ncbi:MAG: hypothetical protein KDD61_01385 [Bdellovibrionales bacterium]|nr:hypothetical protein [Bdellovibrionales bacterium]
MLKNKFIWLSISGIALGYLLTGLLVIVFKKQMPNSSRDRQEKRFEHMMEALPQIAKEPKSTVLFIGTSIYQYCLNPLSFEEALKKSNKPSLKAFNLSFEGNMGFGLLAQMRRLEHEFRKAKTKKFHTIVLEMSPVSYSQKFYERHQVMLEKVHPWIFIDKENRLSFFIKNPTVVAALYSNRWISDFDWYNLRKVKEFFIGPISVPRNKFGGASGYWSRPHFYEKPEWNLATHGFVNWNLPSSKKRFDHLYEYLHIKLVWNRELKRYLDGHAVNNTFQFSTPMLRSLSESVEIAKKLADRVLLVFLPNSPDFQSEINKYIDYDYFTKNVVNSSDTNIVNFTHKFHLSPKDYLDAMHPRHETMNLFLEALADEAF